MATTTVTRPAVIPQPKQILRQAIVVAALLVIGVGLGMLFDSGRSESVEAATLTQGQQAAANRLAAQAAALDTIRAIDAQSARLQGLADSFAAANAAPIPGVFYDPLTSTAVFGDVPVEGHYDTQMSTWVFGPATQVAEHGPFTAMVYRDPSVVQQRFGGLDANLDPDVVIDWALRDVISDLGPNAAAVLDREDADARGHVLDPDAAPVLDRETADAHGFTYDPTTSSLVPMGAEEQGYYDTDSSRWIR